MNSRELKFLFLIIVIFVAAGLETDIYLPAFPDMMGFFGVDEEQIQKLLTWNFVGICIAGPFYGPLSDSYGRRVPLLAALGLFFVGSIITLVSQRFDMMLWGRLLQGLGSGGCFTLGTAIIFDAFRAERAVVAINYLNSIFPCIMAGAPLLGAYLNHAFGFRANFVAVAALVFFSFAAAGLFFRETLPAAKRQPLRLAKLLADFKSALTSVPFWLLVISVCLLFSLWMAFLSTISVLFVLELGVSRKIFPLLQAVPLFAWLVASLTSSPALRHRGVPWVKRVGSGLAGLGGACFALGALVAPTNPYVPTLSMGVYAFGVNWFQGLYFPEAMEILPDIKGVTASLLTSARLLIAAAVVGVTSRYYDGTIYPVAVAMVVVLLVVLPLMLLYERRHGGKVQVMSEMRAAH